MFGADIDGTLLDHGHKPGEVNSVNHAILKMLKREYAVHGINLISNQGGIGMGFVGVDLFADRIRYLISEIEDHEMQAVSLQVSLYHTKADPDKLQQQARRLRDAIRDVPMPWIVYSTERARKPHPYMLRRANIAMYAGDSDEDLKAAEAAGAVFIHVDRFLG